MMGANKGPEPAHIDFAEKSALFDDAYQAALDADRQRVRCLLTSNAILQRADDISCHCMSFSMAMARLLSHAEHVDVPEELLKIRHNDRALMSAPNDSSLVAYKKRLARIASAAAQSANAFSIDIPSKTNHRNGNTTWRQERIAEIVDNLSQSGSSRYLFIHDADRDSYEGAHWAVILGATMTDDDPDLLLLEKAGPGQKMDVTTLSKKLEDMARTFLRKNLRIVIPKQDISEIVAEALREK